MDLLPIELCGIIVCNLPFDAINGLARTCRRLAKLVWDKRVDLADAHVDTEVKYWQDAGRLYTGRGFLPNDVRHGLSYMEWAEYEYTIQVCYVLGRPTHWSINDEVVEWQYWGHVDTRVYLVNMGSGIRHMGVFIKTSTNKHFMTCSRTPGAQVMWQEGRTDMEITDRLPPSPYFVDENIAVESIILWARKYMEDHNIVAIAPNILDSEKRLSAMIEYFPGFDFEKCFGITIQN